MELMRPLLLFALAALLPQALGKSQKLRTENYFEKNVKHNSENKIVTIRKFNDTSAINKVSDLQSVFMEPTCKECHNCMELAIKAHKVHFHVNIDRKVNDVPNELENPEENTTHRNKRNLGVDTDLKMDKKESKKSKIKKNKKNKSFSVTKYSDDNDKIFALKVKEAITPLIAQQNQSRASVTKCQIYRVKKSSSCDSPDADKIIREKKPKIKKQANEQQKQETILPMDNQEKVKNSVPLIIKHHVEDQMFENFMPSIEDMY